MFAVTVKLRILPDKMQEFLPLMTANAAASRDEVGCRQFDVCTDPGKPEEVFLYEIYDDAAAFALHMASRHFFGVRRGHANHGRRKVRQHLRKR